jgi:hypothetical protein
MQMKTRLIPTILTLNKIIADHEQTLDPPSEHEAEALRLICFAKDVLLRARSEMDKAELEKAE